MPPPEVSVSRLCVCARKLLLGAAMPQRVPERIVYDSVRDMPWMRSAPSPTSQAGWSIQFDRCTHPETPLIRCQAHLIRVRCLCLQARLGR